MTQTVKQWIARALVAAMVVMGMPVTVTAQITPTYTFSPNTVIQSAQVNANFNLLLNAVNRNGGTMLATLNTRSLIPTLTNTYDLGSSGLTFRDFYLGRNATIGGTLGVTGAATFGSVTITTFTCTGCVGSTQLASTTVTAAAYGGANSIATFTVDADGRLTAAANVTPQIPISTGVTGLGTGVAAALAVNIGSSGAFVTWGSSPTFGAVTATTLDTGQGANELYDMDQNMLTTSSPAFVALGLTGAATITRAGIGTTGTDAVLATNTTDAANGAQQYSPRVNWTGQGWKTTGGPSASQPVSFIAELRPVQGTVIPTGLWVIASSQNGGVYTDRLTLSTAGALSVASLTLTGTFTNGILSINGNSITSSYASTLAITPMAGQVITFDGTVTLDAGVIAGATSITSTEFTGGGAGITGITEANITDGTVLARLAANETVTGAWSFPSIKSVAFTAGTTAASGKVAEFQVSGSAINETVYDRTGSAYIRKQVDALDFEWRNSGTSAMVLSSAGGLTLASATTAYLGFNVPVDGNLGYVGSANHMFTGGTVDYLGLRGEAGIEFGVGATKYMSLSAGLLIVNGGASVAGSSAGTTVATLTSADNDTDTTLLLFQRLDSGVTGMLKYYNSLGNVMALESSHSVGIKTNGTIAVTVSTAQAVRMHSYGAGTATFDASGNITSVSDERMKNIVGPFTPGLNALMGIKPIRYRYNAASGLDTENIYAGFSAQNVRNFIPEAIGKNLDGFYSLNIVPVLAATVTAVQELTREVDDLRAALKLPVKNRTITPVTDDARVVNSRTQKRLAEIAKADKVKAGGGR